MTKFKFMYKWQTGGNDEPAHQYTMADFALRVGNVNLMLNENIWSRTICDSVVLSAYPLAMWLASSWWRLNWEPLPAHGIYPSLDWRMAHELGAADHGFVWPRIILASDGDMIQVWAGPVHDHENQSVRYLNELETPAFIPLLDFQREAEDFVTTVLNRLDATNCSDTDLANLWRLIQTDQAEQQSVRYRRLEATMGYDPDECIKDVMDKVLELENRMGEDALSELIPIYGRTKPLTDIEEIADSNGLTGTPEIEISDSLVEQGMPWQRAVAAARSLRQAIGNVDSMLDDADLSGLLGLRAHDVEKWTPGKRNDAALAVPMSGSQYKFIPRKRHPLTKRFELARFIGDSILTEPTNEQWLTSTDLSTSRQKFQRAFAAEFLCPIAALRDFLDDDFSESAIEDAVEHFQVSETTVKSLLTNNRLIPFVSMSDYNDGRLPYHL